MNGLMSGLDGCERGKSGIWKEKELDIAELLRTYKSEIHIPHHLGMLMDVQDKMTNKCLPMTNSIHSF